MLPESAAAAFAWRDVVVTLSTADIWLANEVSRFLALPWTIGPGTPAEADIVVARDRTIRWRAGLETCTCDTDDDLLMATAAIVSLSVLERTGSVVLHAGAFVVDGHALLFMGPPMVGKTTLAVSAWRAGFPLLSDDWTVIEPDHVHVTSFPKPIKTRGGDPGTIAAPGVDVDVAHVCRGRLMSGEHRCMYGRSLEGMIGDGLAVPIGACFLVERGTGTSTVIEPASRERALQTVLEQTMHTRGSGLGGVRMLARLLASGAVFDCRMGAHDVDGALTGMVSAFREVCRPR